jgi:hypothetical protein
MDSKAQYAMHDEMLQTHDGPSVTRCAACLGLRWRWLSGACRVIDTYGQFVRSTCYQTRVIVSEKLCCMISGKMGLAGYGKLKQNSLQLARSGAEILI